MFLIQCLLFPFSFLCILVLGSPGCHVLLEQNWILRIKCHHYMTFPLQLWIWCWNCCPLIVHTCTPWKHMPSHAHAKLVWSSFRCSASWNSLHWCFHPGRGFHNNLTNCRKGRVWKVDNTSPIPPCLFLILGHEDIHRDLCCNSNKPSLYLDGKSACISHCFLEETFKGFRYLRIAAVREPRKRLKLIFGLCSLVAPT